MKKYILICAIGLMACSLSAKIDSDKVSKHHDAVTIVDDLQFNLCDLKLVEPTQYFSPAELVQPLVLNCPDNKFKVEAKPLYRSPFVDTRWVWEYAYQFNI